MRNPHNLLVPLFFLSVLFPGGLLSQETPETVTSQTPEQQYEEYITGALRLQVKADSLSRTANQKRRELAFIRDESQRKELENLILSLENESFRIQKEADRLYAQARVLEPELMAGREIPLRPDGRPDPGLALSRAGTAGRQLQQQPAVAADRSADGHERYRVDHGFSVFDESPYSAGNPVPADVILPDGIVYRIQLGIYNYLLTPGTLGGLYPVMMEREPDNASLRYYAGVFGTLSEAEKALTEVNRQGFSDAFIVAWNNGVRLPVNRARQMEHRGPQPATQAAQQSPATSGQPSGLPSRQQTDAASRQHTEPDSRQHTEPDSRQQTDAASRQHTEPDSRQHTEPDSRQQTDAASRQPSGLPSRQQTDAASHRSSGLAPDPPAGDTGGAPAIRESGIVTLKIQLGVFRDLPGQDVYRSWQMMAENRNVEHYRNNSGLYVYSIGNFNNFEDALQMRDQLRKQGVTDAFVVPYIGDRRITMEEAKELLRRQ